MENTSVRFIKSVEITNYSADVNTLGILLFLLFLQFKL